MPISALPAVVPALAVLAILSPSAPGDEGEEARHPLLPEIVETIVEARLDSGPVRAPSVPDGSRHRRVFSGEVVVPGAVSLRLVFDEVLLDAQAGSGRESYLLVTSLYDGHQQFLDARGLRQWRDTSAYFNGESVRVELYAAPGSGDNRVNVKGAMVTMIDAVPRSICGTTDDRVLSGDPRAGRIMPIGCTAWLFDGREHCLLTAGHCGPTGAYVVQFNVPLSTAGGTPQNPGPEDQYAVDPASIQSNGGQGVGNDWAYFGVFENSTTGLTPLEAAGGASYTLAPAAPATPGDTIRVTGFGSTSAPVSPTWYLAQKTHTGAYTGLAGTNIQYAVDTTGGNSGSAVEDITTGLTIGIHTHAGCTSSGGANNGTAIQHAALQAALADPQGVCDLGLDLGFLAEPPGVIDPDGGTTIGVAIVPDAGFTLDPSSVTLHVDTGSGFAPYPMSDAGGSFVGAFPPSECGSTVGYYVSAQDTDGGLHTEPEGAPIDALSAVSADALLTYADHDFEVNPGWAVQNTALSTGAWEIGVPGNFGRSDPAADFDGSGRCWLTGNTSSQDVDGGPTMLTSGVYDLSGADDPVLAYARWHQTNDASGADNLNVEVSADNGSSWTPVESVPNTTGWTEVSVRLADYVPLTAQVRARFSVADNPNASVTESGVDAFRIYDVVCGQACSIADIDANGVLNLDDIDQFIDALLANDPAGDLDGNGLWNLDDIDAFVAAFAAGCP